MPNATTGIGIVLAARIAAEIRAEAARQGIKHKDIAERLGLQPNQVSLRMNGLIEWRLSEVETALAMLGKRLSFTFEAVEPVDMEEGGASL